MGFLFARIDELTFNQKLEELPQALAFFLEKRELDKLKDPVLNSVKFDIEKQASYLLNFLVRFGEDDVGFKTIKVSYDRFKNLAEILGIYPADEATSEKYIGRFKDSYRHYLECIYNKYQYILENFLVNEFFGEAYPFCVHDGLGEVNLTIGFTYRHFVMLFKLAELFLMGLASEKASAGEDVSEDDILSCLAWVFDRMHHGGKSTFISKYLSERPGGDSLLAFMSLMLDPCN